MTQKAYKLVELEELLKLRQAEKAAESQDTKNATSGPVSATVATFDGEPTTNITLKPKEPPDEGEAPHRVNGNGNPMPKSLHGISKMDIELMAIDGNLSGPEQDWWNRRKGRPIDFSHYGKNAWLAF